MYTQFPRTVIKYMLIDWKICRFTSKCQHHQQSSCGVIYNFGCRYRIWNSLSAQFYVCFYHSSCFHSLYISLLNEKLEIWWKDIYGMRAPLYRLSRLYTQLFTHRASGRFVTRHCYLRYFQTINSDFHDIKNMNAKCFCYNNFECWKNLIGYQYTALTKMKC